MGEGPGLLGALSQGLAGRPVTHSFDKHLLNTYCVLGSGAELLTGRGGQMDNG